MTFLPELRHDSVLEVACLTRRKERLGTNSVEGVEGWLVSGEGASHNPQCEFNFVLLLLKQYFFSFSANYWFFREMGCFVLLNWNSYE